MLRASGVRNGGRASTGVYQSDARDEHRARVVGSSFCRWARGDGDSVRGRDWSIAYNVTPLMYQSVGGLVRFRTFGMVHVVVVRSFVRSFVRPRVVTASSSSSVREGVFFLCLCSAHSARVRETRVAWRGDGGAMPSGGGGRGNHRRGVRVVVVRRRRG